MMNMVFWHFWETKILTGPAFCSTSILYSHEQTLRPLLCFCSSVIISFGFRSIQTGYWPWTTWCSEVAIDSKKVGDTENSTHNLNTAGVKDICLIFDLMTQFDSLYPRFSAMFYKDSSKRTCSRIFFSLGNSRLGSWSEVLC